MYAYVCRCGNNVPYAYIFQTGVTPIMLAAMHNNHNVVSLLKNKYGQPEPTPEEMVS